MANQESGLRALLRYFASRHTLANVFTLMVVLLVRKMCFGAGERLLLRSDQ